MKEDVLLTGLMILFTLAVVACLVFPPWYLIHIAHAPNWAVAMFAFLYAGVGFAGGGNTARRRT
jgi:branched-subunit amino acid permease